MSIKIITLAALGTLAIFAGNVGRASADTLDSPNGAIAVDVTKENRDLSYSVSINGKQVLADAMLGYTIKQGASVLRLGQNVRSIVVKSSTNQCADTIVPCHSATLEINHRDNKLPKLEIQFRLFDDGFAFRYHPIINQPYEVLGEPTSFSLPKAKSMWFQDNDAIASHEGKYLEFASATLDNEQVIRLPLTTQLSNGYYVSISEANLLTDSGLRLKYIDNGIFSANFYDESWPATATHVGPWRFIVLSKSLNKLANANMVARLADKPNQQLFLDTSYIKVGKSVWHWLPEGPYGTLPERQKEYIDTAAELGFEYSLIDAGWKRFYPKENPQQDEFLPLIDLVKYAKAKDVGLWLWLDVVDVADPIKRASLFRKLNKIGIVGVKIDFFDVQYGDADSFAAIQSYQAVLIDAAKNKLMVNFHGASKPSGLEYTFPNEMTREGVRGQEFEYKRGWLDQTHNAILPFTRFLLGSGDFTPVRFNATKLAASGNTATHQLALAGLLPSKVINFSFSPDDINRLKTANPAVIDYLKNLPVEWDETRVLSGTTIGGLVVIAKRRNQSWYVFSINGKPSNDPLAITSLSLSAQQLSFLDGNKYNVDVWSDEDITNVAYKQIQNFDASQPLILNYFNNGGIVLKFTPLRAVK